MENFNNKKVEYKPDNCVPIICLHCNYKSFEGEKEIAQNYFESIERGSFSSYRIKELFLSNALLLTNLMHKIFLMSSRK